jgi:GNAT superfamily N-acetyltransferase
MEIRLGEPRDFGSVMAMFDSAVAWLAAQGRTGQWGAEPLSTGPRLRELTAGRIERGELRVAVLDGEVVGALSVSETCSEYVRAPAEPELFVNLLLTERRLKGSGIGAALLEEARAEARRRGLSLLRVDCYRGDDQKLVGYYRGQGFTEVEPFTIARGDGRPDWPGMLLAMRLA